MAPIRVGFQGLSADTPLCWANHAHLPYFKKTSDYQIVALCNSSRESGQRAAQLHQLDPHIKIYATPEALAADPDVDMVICSVNVGKHYDLIKPAILAGKLPVVEWPLASNLAQAEELTSLAREKGLKTLVILQGRLSPVTAKVRQLIADGRIGEVFSVNLDAVAGYHGEDPIGVGGMYLSDRKVGGNMATIHFGHAIDTFLSAVGQVSSFTSYIANKRPFTKVIDRAQTPPTVVHEAFPKDTPDQIMLQGRLVSGALISVHMRGGRNFPGAPGMEWRIYGSTGEIRVVCPGHFLHMGFPKDTPDKTTEKFTYPGDGEFFMDMKFEVHDFATGEVEAIEIDQDEWDDLRREAQNPARVYEAYRKGDMRYYATFEEALERQKFIDKIMEGLTEAG
ncbi:hypothetical protein BP5796_07687 [Coleophoma crateriformis]|uniref:Gfo/Idh/MocA-like oxidoreductase N-terminal domain-containing protein n=1 Tax=Coleophoma crateriformis TaxID=565419 RepID=A0A3D8RC76_9HELO|nr:hypothetical protein BP5796_07687 [Coleophoma crateriformis]